MAQPEKAARPAADAWVVVPLQARVPPDGLAASASVTGTDVPLARLPHASSTRTSGCVANGEPPSAAAGAVANARPCRRAGDDPEAHAGRRREPRRRGPQHVARRGPVEGAAAERRGPGDRRDGGAAGAGQRGAAGVGGEVHGHGRGRPARDVAAGVEEGDDGLGRPGGAGRAARRLGAEREARGGTDAHGEGTGEPVREARRGRAQLVAGRGPVQRRSR